jgi:predicted Zn-dependent protease
MLDRNIKLMIKKIKFFNLLILLLIAEIAYTQNNKKPTYDLSCFQNNDINDLSFSNSEIEQNILRAFGSNVNISEEIELGNKIKKFILSKYTIIKDEEKNLRLKSILNKLVKSISKITSPRGFKYEVFLISDKEINAFTSGGNIFITTGIYNFCLNDNEIASIISHEISHNELGHINDQIKRSKTAEDFGNAGLLASEIGNYLTTPFNQRNEAYCDFMGIDLCFYAGYNICSTFELWSRMDNNGSSTLIEEFLSTHPPSKTRGYCAKRHIYNKFNYNCK